tara:strand:+ start:643 stop:792 length:150 start_codon:yes stop_codon:yes gene_type:complete
VKTTILSMVLAITTVTLAYNGWHGASLTSFSMHFLLASAVTIKKLGALS